jgi:hypothetical protein
MKSTQAHRLSVTSLFLALSVTLLAPNRSEAGPGVIDHQGRVAVGGTPFHGEGQFKFALVNGGLDQARTASGTASVNSGFITEVQVTDGGRGYASPPNIVITSASGSNAVLRALVAGGVVTGVEVVNPGRGYSPSVTLGFSAPPPDMVFETYWSNDGSSKEGREPERPVSLPVTRGLYAVPLGDTEVPGMSAIPTEALAHPDVRLRIWFEDGVHGFQRLSPDRPLSAAPYARIAGTVADGAITAAKIAPGSIGPTQLTSPLQIPGLIASQVRADAAVWVDGANQNPSSLAPGILFGSGLSEGISSPRTQGPNQNGLDFYTASTRRMSITSDGRLGLGTAAPRERLDVGGAAVLGNSSNPTPAAGTVRWNGTEFEGFTGTEWISFSGIRSRTIPYDLAAAESSPPIPLPLDMPVLVMGTQNHDLYPGLSRGLGQATLLANIGIGEGTDLWPNIQWLGLEPAPGSVITSGEGTVPGTHILYLDYSHSIELVVAGPNSVRVRARGIFPGKGVIRMIW